MNMLGSALDLALVIIGFGLIVFIHELGHFVAAKWAGIRVLAFAMGFGPAAVSYRKGLGWRRGSSEPEVAKLREEAVGSAGDRRENARATLSRTSFTEYRFNWLPFGGYVKMLGQDDMDPTAVSTASDSYQNCKVWKRMVVISAGVVLNVAAAAVLFIAVFMVGLTADPARVGVVLPGSPASRAVARSPGIETGLQPGDLVLSVNGRKARSFNDLMMASAMSRRGESMHMLVSRPGVPSPIEFDVSPEPGRQTKLREIGVGPSSSATLVDVKTPDDIAEFNSRVRAPGVEPGMRLVAVGSDTDIQGASDLVTAAAASEGRPLSATFEGASGKRVTVELQPRPELQAALVETPAGVAEVTHLLGLVPVVRVAPGSAAEGTPPAQGLKEGDVFARVGTVEYPSFAQATAEIRRNKRQQVPVEVLRSGASGVERIRIQPDPTVNRKGHLGFLADFSGVEQATIVALPPARLTDPRSAADPLPPAATRIISRPGTRVVAVGGRSVSTFGEMREALRSETLEAFKSGAESAKIEMALEPPSADPAVRAPMETVAWTLFRRDLEALHALKWDSPIALGLFEPETIKLKAQGNSFPARALEAVRLGGAETYRVMVMTYATFQRLFEGTVKVEHLKGPVGIAHMGTIVVSRGFIWLLFFMALISVNLAVVNFLPLPIVDGGQFLFLVLEAIRGRPVSIQVQNIATIAGLLLIGTMFLIVTFQDVANLFG